MTTPAILPAAISMATSFVNYLNTTHLNGVTSSLKHTDNQMSIEFSTGAHIKIYPSDYFNYDGYLLKTARLLVDIDTILEK